MRTRIYVDGFNLYYGCLKNSPHKWLDLKRLFQNILSHKNEIEKISYFTAKINIRDNNPEAPQRQRSYINALKAYIPEIEIYYGHFLEHEQSMRNAYPPPLTCRIIKAEEKGSDVNLAVHLLNDAWLDKFECGVVVSNDSDMAESMNLIHQYHPKKVLGLITPYQKKISKELKTHAHFVKTIRSGDLKKAHLPAHIPHTNIVKPSAWS